MATNFTHITIHSSPFCPQFDTSQHWLEFLEHISPKMRSIETESAQEIEEKWCFQIFQKKH